MIMREDLDYRGNSVLMPFLLGGIMGAGLALLLAPKPGKEFREDIKRFTTRTRDRVSVAIDKGKELYDESRTAVTGVIEAAKSVFDHEKEKWQHAS